MFIRATTGISTQILIVLPTRYKAIGLVPSILLQAGPDTLLTLPPSHERFQSKSYLGPLQGPTLRRHVSRTQKAYVQRGWQKLGGNRCWVTGDINQLYAASGVG
jgi:hypothetical protein